MVVPVGDCGIEDGPELGVLAGPGVEGVDHGGDRGLGHPYGKAGRQALAGG